MKTRIGLVLVGAIAVATVAGGVAMAERGDGGWKRGHSERGMDRGGRGRGAGMMRMIEAYDTDGDGGVTQEELTAARAAQLAEFDTDGDGSLTLEEYQALWMDVMRERMVDQFQSHDDDGDGSVTVAEFGERFERFVDRADRNGDGIVNADDLGRAEGRRGGPRRDAQEAPSE